MAQPTPYTRQYDLASVQSGNSLAPIPGSYLDTELDAVKNTLDQTLANLALIQRDDGALKNGIVGVAALSTDVRALMATGAAIRGTWVTATAYTIGNIVENGGLAYFCLAAHTSGTFATDLAASKWVLLTGTDPADGSVTTVKIADLNVTTGKLAADAVTFAKMQNITSDRLIGRDTAASGDPEEISVGGGLEFTGSAGIQRSALTGDVTASAGSNATTIAADAVTYAKIQDVTNTKRVLGRNTAGSGVVEEVTVQQLLNWLGTAAQGDVFYQGASDPARLAAGTSGQFLKTQGAAANPIWAWGSLVQVAVGSLATMTTGTTVVPADDTIPQNTEGDEYLTVSITPKSASNTIEIDVTLLVGSQSQPVVVALFQDSTADALAAVFEDPSSANPFARVIRFVHRMTAGTTSATTFKVRAGVTTAGTLTVNGQTGARLLGGVAKSYVIARELSV